MTKSVLTFFGLAALWGGLLGPACADNTITISDSNYGNGVFSGYNWVSTDPNTPAVRITTAQPVTITNCIISAPGTLIDADDAQNLGAHNLTITNTSGYGTNTNILAQGQFLAVAGSTQLAVEHCSLEGTGGIFVDNWYGPTDGSSTIHIRYNRSHNVRGGTYSDAFIAMRSIKNVPGIEIRWNEDINDYGASSVGDNINLYSVNTPASNPALIHDNYIQGAYHTFPDFNGGGIDTDGGNDGVDHVTAFVRIFDNQVVACDNYGIGLYAGHDNIAYNNRCIRSGIVNGKPEYDTVKNSPQVQTIFVSPLAIQDFAGEPYPDFSNNTAQNNVFGYVFIDGNGTGSQAGENLTDGISSGDTYLDHLATPQDESNELRSWAQKLSGSNVAVGNNYLINPGFETGDLSHWILYDGGNNSTLFPENLGTGVEHSGTYHLAMWHGTAYEAYASQIATSYQGASLPSGTYTATAWVQSTGVNPNNGDAVEMYVYQYDASGGGYMAVPVPTTGASRGDWRQVTIPNIPVSGGKCEVGFHIKDSAGNHWLRVDDIQLFDPLVKPAVPTGVKAVAGSVGTKKITLSWNKVAGATSYKVYRAPSSGGTYSQIGTATTLSYVNTGLTAGTTYFYKVSAANAAGTSGQSTYVSAKAQ